MRIMNMSCYVSNNGYTLYFNRSFRQVKEKWDKLYHMCNAYPFQSTAVMEALSSLPYRVRTHSKLLFCEIINEENKLVAIIPYRKSGGTVAIGGVLENLDYVDCVFDPDLYTENAISLFVDGCCDNGVKRIIWKYIDEQSKTNVFLKKVMSREIHPGFVTIVSEYQNVAINYDCSSYEAWNKTLKKSVRQNLRTSYNRMEKDGASWEYELLHSSDPVQVEKVKDVKSILMRVYEEHLHSRYGAGKSQIVFRRLWHYVSRTIFDENCCRDSMD